jgi:predicted transcriptional regulator
MDTAPRPDDRADAISPETEAERQRRLVWEAEGIARARASVAAGYYATSAEVKTWIDSLGTDNPLPVPYPRHKRPR